MLNRRARILAVDDEPNVTRVIERGLTAEGYECLTSSSPHQALEMMERQEFDLALVDLRMPEMSGLELLHEIAARFPDTAVMMVTAIADTATAVEAMREGAFDYVTKPFNLDELVTRIENALERRRLKLENREYQENLEGMVAERTEQLEGRVRELLALNRLFQEHLRQRSDIEDAFRGVLEKMQQPAGGIAAFTEQAQRQPELAPV